MLDKGREKREREERGSSRRRTTTISIDEQTEFKRAISWCAGSCVNGFPIDLLPVS